MLYLVSGVVQSDKLSVRIHLGNLHTARAAGTAGIARGGRPLGVLFYGLSNVNLPPFLGAADLRNVLLGNGGGQVQSKGRENTKM